MNFWWISYRIKNRGFLSIRLTRIFATNVNRFCTSTLTLTSFSITSKRAVYIVAECWFCIVAGVAVVVCCWFLHGYRGSVVGGCLRIAGCRSVFPLFVPSFADQSDIFWRPILLILYSCRWFQSFASLLRIFLMIFAWRSEDLGEIFLERNLSKTHTSEWWL